MALHVKAIGLCLIPLVVERRVVATVAGPIKYEPTHFNNRVAYPYLNTDRHKVILNGAEQPALTEQGECVELLSRLV